MFGNSDWETLSEKSTEVRITQQIVTREVIINTLQDFDKTLHSTGLGSVETQPGLRHRVRHVAAHHLHHHHPLLHPLLAQHLHLQKAERAGSDAEENWTETPA